jgi:hypothetical protein
MAKTQPADEFLGLFEISDSELRWQLGGGLDLALGPGPEAGPEAAPEAEAYVSEEARFLCNIRENLALMSRLYILTVGMYRDFPQSPQWGAVLERRSTKLKNIDQALYDLGCALRLEGFDPRTYTESPEELHPYRIHLTKEYARVVEALRAKYATLKAECIQQGRCGSREFQDLQAEVRGVSHALQALYRTLKS